MRRLILLSVACALGACSSATSIEGKVIVGPGKAGLGVVAVLWQNQLAPSDPKVPNSPLVEQPVPIAEQAVGTTTTGGAEFPYTFHTVGKGSFIVGAYIDINGDLEITSDEISIDLAAPPLQIDPDDSEKRTARRDIYVGMSAPDRVTLSGFLHRSALAASRTTEILVLNGPLSDANATVVGRQTVSAGGLNVPWKIHNVAPGSLHVIAIDDYNLQGLIAVHAGNPLLIALEGSAEFTGIDVWLDLQAPGLGSVSGQVQLNDSPRNVRLQLWLFDADPTDPAVNARIVGWVNTAVNATQVPFQFVSMPLRKLYLAGAISVREPNGQELSTTRIYRLGKSPTPLDITAEAPSKTEIVFPMGVGRVSGTITVENATKGLDFWVFAMVNGAVPPDVHQYDVFVSPADGNVQIPYAMFGLEDGEYPMQLVPDTTGVDGPNDELSRTPPFVFDANLPGRVEIVGGDRVAADFTVKLKAKP